MPDNEEEIPKKEETTSEKGSVKKRWVPRDEIPPEEIAERYKVRTMKEDIARLKGEAPPAKVGAPPEKLPVAPEKPKEVPRPASPKPPVPLKKPEEIKKPPLPEKPKPKIRLKTVVIALILAIIVIGGGGFYYWWNYVRVVEEEPEKTELEIPLSLIDVDETSIIELNEGEETALFDKLKEKAAETRAEEFFLRILVKKITPEKDYFLSFKEISEIIGINIPASVSDSLTEEDTLFLYAQSEGNRLGVVVKISDAETLKTEMESWEATMKDDLIPFFLGKELGEPATEEFQDNVYSPTGEAGKEVDIRYLNFPGPDLTIDYAIINDYLLITTSRESIYRTISEILEAEPTANWKTYRNEEYGFEFKYPPLFKFQQPSQPSINDEVWLGYFQLENGGQLSLTIKQERLDPENIQGIYGKIEKERLKTITINNRTAYMYTEGDAGCGGYVVEIPSNDITIKLRFVDCEADKNKMESYREDVLPTFKFLD